MKVGESVHVFILKRGLHVAMCCATLPKGQLFKCGVNMCFNKWKSEKPMLIIMKVCTLNIWIVLAFYACKFASWKTPHVEKSTNIQA